MPSAPAKAASHRPAFGLGCRGPSRSTARNAEEAGPTAGYLPADGLWADVPGGGAAGLRAAGSGTTAAQAMVSAAVTRAGIQLAASSRRADAQPKRRYRGER